MIQRAKKQIEMRLGQTREDPRNLVSPFVLVAVLVRDGTGSHIMTQRPSDPGIQRPRDPVNPVTLFYNELQMSTYV